MNLGQCSYKYIYIYIYIYIVSRSKTQMLDQVFLITWKVTGHQISMFLEIMAILCTWKAYLVPAFINEVSDYTCALILTSKSIVNTCYESIVNINNLTLTTFIPTPQPALPTPPFRSALWMPIKLRAHGYLKASFSCRLDLREDRKLSQGSLSFYKWKVWNRYHQIYHGVVLQKKDPTSMGQVLGCACK